MRLRHLFFFALLPPNRAGDDQRRSDMTRESAKDRGQVSG